ncbi:MAG: glycosyltransferase family 4 protein [Actinomycetota bacterium]|nr:glycosyltransferase family 4 protein [Actinomycetota bacterium]
MRILLAVSMVPQADGLGAIPKLLHAQLLGLRERHQVTVVGSYGDLPGQAEAARELMGAGDIAAHFADRRRSSSPRRRWRVRAELASAWATKGWPWRAVSATGGVQAMVDRAAAEGPFDVVALEEDLMSVLRLPTGAPVVLTEHEAFQASEKGWKAMRLRERPEMWLRRRDWARWAEFRRSAWERADLVQVYSDGDAEAIAGAAPELASRVRVNPFGLVPPAAADPAAEAAGTILFSGTFTHLPNREAALWLAEEILPAVRAREPGATLRIVGSAPPAEIRGLAGPGIEVIADAPSMEPHLQAAAVVVAPVRSGGGMRMKVLEAMARGKAVVTTPLGAEGFNSIDPEPPLALADDSEGIAAALAELLGDEPERRELGRRAREFTLRHHSPEAWAERLEAVYEEARTAGRGGSR